MKIFISHSSRDKWAARRISQELEAIGINTFLDEKDIETGDSIDVEISRHLKDCDELLVLLSPASIKSEWVLIEVGGAKALGKRLIPILLYLGANDIPSPISKKLARDINSIERYYDEVKERLEKNLPAPEPTIRKRIRKRPSLAAKAFKVGDTVRLPSSPRSLVSREDYLISWEDSDMNAFLGETAKITEVDKDKTVKIDIDEGESWWAFEWLTKET